MMKYQFKKLAALLLGVCMLLSLFTSCGKTEEDIYILFTGDAHCADDENIGYAGLKAFADMIKAEKSQYVTLVDTGDAVWGDFLGNQSEGEYIVDLMNQVGYDFAVLGNHEFDYGLEQLGNLISQSEAVYLGCNIFYTGKGENQLSALKPYAIETYGKTKVGFVGVTTPESITACAPMTFMEDGEIAYDFLIGDDGTKFYAEVQEQIDACRAEGADHVILLTHLGDGEEYGNYSSVALIAATTGADAVLDGHAHSTIPARLMKNKDGDEVLLASTGTKLQNIGVLLITPSGNLTVSLYSGMTDQNDTIAGVIDDANLAYETILAEKIGMSEVVLSTHSEDGQTRLVRSQETAIGNFCADAFRMVTGADLAFINGGGIRASLPAGDLTYGDILALCPYGNNICVVKTTGAEIADALEFSYRLLALDENGKALIEDGGFLQVSGLRFRVDTSVMSTVKTDENGLFVSVEGERRVKDLMILGKDGTYAPIDLDAEYTLAAFNFTLQECGDGFTMFVDNEYEISLGKFDYEVLIAYIQSFENDTIPSQYATIEGRIVIQ